MKTKAGELNERYNSLDEKKGQTDIEIRIIKDGKSVFKFGSDAANIDRLVKNAKERLSELSKEK
jgi:hypothetical protein